MSVSHCRIDAGVVEKQLLSEWSITKRGGITEHRSITKHQYDEMYFSEGAGDDGEGSGSDDDAPVDSSDMPEGMQLYFMSTYALLCMSMCFGVRVHIKIDTCIYTCHMHGCRRVCGTDGHD